MRFVPTGSPWLSAYQFPSACSENATNTGAYTWSHVLKYSAAESGSTNDGRMPSCALAWLSTSASALNGPDCSPVMTTYGFVLHPSSPHKLSYRTKTWGLDVRPIMRV